MTEDRDDERARTQGDVRAPGADGSVGTRWREGVARQARAIYESAHGNPVSDEARGVRWALTPRVAFMVCVVVLIAGVVLMWALRAPGGVLVAEPAGQLEDGGALSPSTPSGVSPSSSAHSAGPDGAWGNAAGDVVIVDVAGHVVDPGVRELPAGARVADAIDAAGGVLPDAASEGPNLARVLVDGEQVFVPGQDEQQGPDGTGGVSPGKINVNRGDEATLEGLPGVGPVLAQRIVEYREANGPFASLGDLEAVSGIGPAMLEKLIDAATV